MVGGRGLLLRSVYVEGISGRKRKIKISHDMGAGGSKGSVGCRDVEVSGVGSIGVCVCVCSGCQGDILLGCN